MFTTILFDIDGVMLSEERYFDASALTIHELVASPRFLGLHTISDAFTPTPTDAAIQHIRRQVFSDDGVIEQLKNVGVNANWDMVYFVFVSELVAALNELADTPSRIEALSSALSDGWTTAALRDIGAIIRSCSNETIAWASYDTLYGGASSRDELYAKATLALDKFLPRGHHHALWDIGQDVFQEWYLGDSYTGRSTEKRGFLSSEYAIVDPGLFSTLLADFHERGLHLGVATGRPRTETEVPLASFGWWDYFNSRYVTTATDVVDAERLVPTARPLSKPHPFSYLRSLTGEHDVTRLLEIPLPKQDIHNEVLVVGDSIADGLAAKRLGASFAAVLTGLEGEAARPKFRQLGADYILTNVLEVRDII